MGRKIIGKNSKAMVEKNAHNDSDSIYQNV